MNSERMISVCMITYNHEKYIRRAIEGVLSQDVRCSFELAIFNDASTDQTDSIIREIICLHPKGKLINYHVHQENIGLSANYIWSIKHCSGRYIAICEGDDYWIDNNKLQRQFDFLEQNPEYVLTFHQALRINMETNEYGVYPQTGKQSFDEAAFFELTTIPMASVMFRNEQKPSFILGHSQMDFLLLCSLLSRGKAWFMKEVMSVYRVHSGGATFNHFSARYLRNRINELTIEARLREFSPDVRRQVSRLYVKHALAMVSFFPADLRKQDIWRFFLNSIWLKNTATVFWKDYLQMLSSIVFYRRKN